MPNGMGIQATPETDLPGAVDRRRHPARRASQGGPTVRATFARSDPARLGCASARAPSNPPPSRTPSPPPRHVGVWARGGGAARGDPGPPPRDRPDRGGHAPRRCRRAGRQPSDGAAEPARVRERRHRVRRRDRSRLLDAAVDSLAPHRSHPAPHGMPGHAGDGHAAAARRGAHARRATARRWATRRRRTRGAASCPRRHGRRAGVRRLPVDLRRLRPRGEHRGVVRATHRRGTVPAPAPDVRPARSVRREGPAGDGLRGAPAPSPRPRPSTACRAASTARATWSPRSGPRGASGVRLRVVLRRTRASGEPRSSWSGRIRR